MAARGIMFELITQGASPVEQPPSRKVQMLCQRGRDVADALAAKSSARSSSTTHPFCSLSIGQSKSHSHAQLRGAGKSTPTLDPERQSAHDYG